VRRVEGKARRLNGIRARDLVRRTVKVVGGKIVITRVGTRRTLCAFRIGSLASRGLSVFDSWKWISRRFPKFICCYWTGLQTVLPSVTRQ
jgi:hypothetical protein